MEHDAAEMLKTAKKSAMYGTKRKPTFAFFIILSSIRDSAAECRFPSGRRGEESESSRTLALTIDNTPSNFGQTLNLVHII
jgi:hypothetical protein